MDWEILETGVASVEKNMACDANLLARLSPDSRPILHLYAWEKECATYGHFINPYEHLNQEGVLRCGLQLAKRPTGGGIVFHLCDFAFSVLIPATHPNYSLNTLDNYAFINQMVVEAVQKFKKTRFIPELLSVEEPALDLSCRHFCMAKPTKYDVMLQGKKVGGAAQRRTKLGFLHQGTISLQIVPEKYLQELLKPDNCVLEAMRRYSFPLIDENCTAQELKEARAVIRQYLIESLPQSAEC